MIRGLLRLLPLLAAVGVASPQEDPAGSVRKLLDAHKYSEAETAARELIATAEAATGPDSKETAEALNLLLPALVHGGKFNTPEALEIARRGVAIREKLYGPDHPGVAVGLNGLGALFLRLGRDEEARPLILRALAIYDRTADRDSLKAYAAWSNLGFAASNIGDYGEARRCYDRAIAIAEKNSDDGRMAAALDGAAINFRHLGEYARARAAYERAVALFERHFGPDDETVAGPLNNLAQLFLIIGEPQHAEPLFQRALRICEKAFGPDSYRAADMLAGLGMAKANTGDFTASRSLFNRVIQLRRKYQADSHDLAGDLTEFALLLSRTGDFERAHEAALEAETLSRRSLELNARILPERQALKYAATRVKGLDAALSLIASGAPVSRSRTMEALIRSRALVFDEMAARHRLQVESWASETAPDTGRLSREYSTARERLSSLVIQGAVPESIAEAARQKDRAETALATKSVSLRRELNSRRAGLVEVAGAIDRDAVLVSFIRYDRRPVELQPSGRIFDIDPVPSYIAFVLRGGSVEPVAVSLGPANEIDALVAALRKQVSQEARAPGESPKRSEAAYRASGVALRRRIWDPLARFTASAKTVFVVPDGSLHLVNLSALPVGGSEYLIDKGPLVHYLSSERDLLPNLEPLRGQGLLALGDPAFGARGVEIASGGKVFRGKSSDCGSFRSMRFEPLPASAREIDEIATLWRKDARLGGVRELRSRAASEAAFKQEAPGKRVLHVAAHGFFLGDCPSALDPGSKAGDAGNINGENPLLLSGLALAGANLRHTGAEGSEDGILTAEEIASMDLSGVEWAVLSACETGIGELRAGEGVFGLRRAFQVAGVRTVIMSLWPVEDRATEQWMTALYERRFLKHLGTAQAVRDASFTVLERLRHSNRGTHPFYWAGFVAGGDWK